MDCRYGPVAYAYDLDFITHFRAGIALKLTTGVKGSQFRLIEFICITKGSIIGQTYSF